MMLIRGGDKMNKFDQWTAREKVFLLIIILLLSFMVVGSRTLQTINIKQETDDMLYRMASSESQNGDFALAASYLYAYIQRNPVRYANNTQGHRDAVNKVFQEWMQYIRNDRYYAEQVRVHIGNCGHFPCENKSAKLGTSFTEVFPSNKVMVCENNNYRGKCSYLNVGEYNRWEKLGVANDSISSVMLGEDVKVLLCVHSLGLLSDCLELSQNDPNLADNMLPGKKYSLNNNVSTARVTLKPGRGVTLP
jgi:hypothetical protein